MPDHTTTSAAAYLTERGYLVHSKRDGTDKPASSGTIKQWCERGKIKARKAGWVWLISQETLDTLLTDCGILPVGNIDSIGTYEANQSAAECDRG